MAGPVQWPELGQHALVNIRAILPELRPSERRIAELFIADPASAAELSIHEVAERCSTSTTSVIRFCRSLGYQHFRDLRMDVLREITRESIETAGLPEVSGDIDQGDTLADVVAKISLAETMSIADTAKTLSVEALQRAVDAVCAAERVDVFGVGASSSVGEDLQQKLIRIGRTALSWGSTHSAWTSAATLNERTVAIAVSHSSSTMDTVEFLAMARSCGATTIAITNHSRSPLAAHADIVLTTAARETGFRSGALGSRIAQLMVVDCLFIGVAQASFDQSMTAIRRTYAATHRLSASARPVLTSEE